MKVHFLVTLVAMCGLVISGCDVVDQTAAPTNPALGSTPDGQQGGQAIAIEIPESFEGEFNPDNMTVGLRVGNLAPEIQGSDLDGTPFKLSDYRGKVVMLDFWGHW